MERTVKNVKELIEQGLSSREMAKIFGITQTPMYLWLKRRGLSTKFKGREFNKRSWTDEQLIEAVKTSVTKIAVIKKLGLSIRPGNYDTINKFILKLNINIDHFTGKAHGTTRHSYNDKDVFVENSTYAREGIKRRIIDGRLINYECSECYLKKWNDKKIVLVLDHINGVNNDHRIENLRFLCPNCNSQQDTFCRRNPPKHKDL